MQQKKRSISLNRKAQTSAISYKAIIIILLIILLGFFLFSIVWRLQQSVNP